MSVSRSPVVKRPPGSLAGWPLRRTAGGRRFRSSLDGVTNERTLCSALLLSSVSRAAEIFNVSISADRLRVSEGCFVGEQ